MPPPAARPAAGFKRRREVTTLDEDEWTSRIEAIIQRDYYPDLPKLQNKLEWLQASRQLLLFISHSTLQPLFVNQFQLRLTYVPDTLFWSQLFQVATAGSQEWRCHANTTSTVEHCTAAGWNQDTCRSNASCIWHAWCQPVENSRLGHSSFWNTSNDTWLAGHSRFVELVCIQQHMCSGAGLRGVKAMYVRRLPSLNCRSCYVCSCCLTCVSALHQSSFMLLHPRHASSCTGWHHAESWRMPGLTTSLHV